MTPNAIAAALGLRITEEGGQPAPPLQPAAPPPVPNRETVAPPPSGAATRPAVGNIPGANVTRDQPNRPVTTNSQANSGTAAADPGPAPVVPFLSQEEINRKKELAKMAEAAKPCTALKVIPGHKASMLSVGE